MMLTSEDNKLTLATPAEMIRMVKSRATSGMSSERVCVHVCVWGGEGGGREEWVATCVEYHTVDPHLSDPNGTEPRPDM